jgi:hypothetical protein
MRDVGKFNGHFGLFYGQLLYFTDIWDILWLFGHFFAIFGMFYREKSGNPVGALCQSLFLPLHFMISKSKTLFQCDQIRRNILAILAIFIHRYPKFHRISYSRTGLPDFSW